MVEGGSRYQPILTSIWTDEKFTKFNDVQKVLWMYLLTCPHSNMLGLYRLPVGYAVSDLHWSSERFQERFGELLQEQFLEWDEEGQIVLIKNHLKHRPLENQNQVKAAIKVLDTIPRTPLFSSLLSMVERFGKPFTKPLQERLRERLSEPVNRKPLTVNRKSETPCAASADAPPQEETTERHLGKLLYDLIQKHDPKFKEPNWQNWDGHLEKLIRLDNRTPEEVETVIRWCQADDFWHKNILSAETLRRQFVKLWMKAKGGNHGTAGGKGGGARDGWHRREDTEQVRGLKPSAVVNSLGPERE